MSNKQEETEGLKEAKNRLAAAARSLSEIGKDARETGYSILPKLRDSVESQAEYDQIIEKVALGETSLEEEFAKRGIEL